MKNLNQKQIELIKSLRVWSSTNFHGNTKRVNGVPVRLIKEIITKKCNRELAKIDYSKKSDAELVRELIGRNKAYKNTPYQKIMIEGNTGIYLASPVHLHSDYNKSRLFDKSEKTLKLMGIYNSVITKTLTN
tara:strand:+ start:1025 stop:1420 length:396 start_codon:yes stop_codon:yes gene_type:complete